MRERSSLHHNLARKYSSPGRSRARVGLDPQGRNMPRESTPPPTSTSTAEAAAASKWTSSSLNHKRSSWSGSHTSSYIHKRMSATTTTTTTPPNPPAALTDRQEQEWSRRMDELKEYWIKQHGKEPPARGSPLKTVLQQELDKEAQRNNRRAKLHAALLQRGATARAVLHPASSRESHSVGSSNDSASRRSTETVVEKEEEQQQRHHLQQQHRQEELEVTDTESLLDDPEHLKSVTTEERSEFTVGRTHAAPGDIKDEGTVDSTTVELSVQSQAGSVEEERDEQTTESRSRALPPLPQPKQQPPPPSEPQSKEAVELRISPPAAPQRQLLSPPQLQPQSYETLDPDSVTSQTYFPELQDLLPCGLEVQTPLGLAAALTLQQQQFVRRPVISILAVSGHVPTAATTTITSSGAIVPVSTTSYTVFAQLPHVLPQGLEVSSPMGVAAALTATNQQNHRPILKVALLVATASATTTTRTTTTNTSCAPSSALKEDSSSLSSSSSLSPHTATPSLVTSTKSTTTSSSQPKNKGDSARKEKSKSRRRFLA